MTITDKDLSIRSGRGRRRGFDKMKVLDIAMDVFWHFGYEGTSITDLTSATKLSPTSLYAAFGSKEKLYREALKHYGSGKGAFTTDLMALDGTAREAISSVLSKCAECFTNSEKARGCMIATAIVTDTDENAAISHHLTTLRRHAMMTFVGRIEAAISTGELPGTTNPESVARFFEGIIQAMSIQAKDGASYNDLKILQKMAIDAWDVVITSSSDTSSYVN